MQQTLPKYRKSRKGGRPRVDLRRVADAIFYRLRTGCQWKAIPPALCAGSTAHDYFTHWIAKGVFEKLWLLALEEYDDLIGLDWSWQSVDGAMTKAPLGGESTGNHPTDRGKRGVKRSMMTDAHGIPLGQAVDGANVHDIRLLQCMIEKFFQPSRLRRSQVGRAPLFGQMVMIQPRYANPRMARSISSHSHTLGKESRESHRRPASRMRQFHTQPNACFRIGS